jgi:tripartite tricarboxylate transporter TctB family protein
MSRRVQENLIAMALFVVFVAVILMCQDFGPRARMIPLPLAILGLVLTTVQIIWQNLGSTEGLQMDMITVSAPEAAGKKEAEAQTDAKPGGDSTHSWRKEAGAFAIVGALLALVLLLGPVPAVFIFTAAYFALTRYYSFRTALVYTAVFTAVTYLLFFVALEIQPYHGLLAPLVEQLP